MTEKQFKVVDDYLVSYDGDYFDLHKPSDVRSLVTVVNYIVDELNALHEENIKLRTLNYVNKEAVRLNNIKTVKIGREDVDCSNINWELLYELYNKMIDFYYDESGDLE